LAFNMPTAQYCSRSCQVSGLRGIGPVGFNQSGFVGIHLELDPSDLAGIDRTADGLGMTRSAVLRQLIHAAYGAVEAGPEGAANGARRR
jgi:Ribbon-helix-helix protein, copG family